MEGKAVIVCKGTKYNICCDINLLPDFFEYVMKDASHCKEIKLIFAQIREGHRSKKYGDEPHGTKSMKPFKNRDNDRIICNITKRKGKKQCIVMAEIFLSKKSDGVDKKLDGRYKIVSKYNYEIIEET